MFESFFKAFQAAGGLRGGGALAYSLQGVPLSAEKIDDVETFLLPLLASAQHRVGDGYGAIQADGGDDDIQSLQDQIRSAVQQLQVYILLMESWVEALDEGRALTETIEDMDDALQHISREVKRLCSEIQCLCSTLHSRVSARRQRG